MNSVDYMRYFGGYPEPIRHQIEALIASGNLATHLKNKYPEVHKITNDKLLFEYVNELRQDFLPKTKILNRVCFEKTKDLIKNALGTHTFVGRNHGGKLVSKHEIRISDKLKVAPEVMLRMLVVHELSHFKEKDHNKAFYNLCCHMMPEYHQAELDLRLYLVLLEMGQGIY